MFVSTGAEFDELLLENPKVLERGLEKPAKGEEERERLDNRPVEDEGEASEPYDCDLDLEAMGTVRRLRSSLLGFVGDGGTTAFASGISFPWAAATSWASVQSDS